MEGAGGQEQGLLFFEPLGLGEGLTLGAVTVPTGVVGGVLVATGITLIEMAAELSSATAFDGSHGLVMR